VDCTPDGFSGNEGEDVPTQLMRNTALCLGMGRWLIACLYNQAHRFNNPPSYPKVLALMALSAPPDFVNEIIYANAGLSLAKFREMIDDDTAFDDALCMLQTALIGKPNSFVEFKEAIKSLVDLLPDDAPEPLVNMIMVAYAYSQNRINYAVFSRAIEQAFDDIKNGDTYECPC